jgi:HAD superfamily hydrolase (TIGR01450 family)
MAAAFSRPEAVLFDVNGTLVWASEAIPGAPEAVAALSRRLRVCYLTNDPRGDEAAIAARLEAHGYMVPPGSVLSAVQLAAAHLAGRYPGGRILLVGSAGLRDALLAAGLEVVEEPPAVAVLISGTRALTADTLRAACEAIWYDGAAFFASSLDRRVPYAPGKHAPGTGAAARAVAWATGQEPEVLGKPSSLTVEGGRRLLGVSPSAAVVVGDSLEEDVALGKRMGARTALVLSGAAEQAHLTALPADQLPDVVVDRVGPALLDWIERL